MAGWAENCCAFGFRVNDKLGGGGTDAITFAVVIGAVGKAEVEVVEQEEEVLAKVVIGTCMIEREEGVVGGEDIVCPIEFGRNSTEEVVEEGEDKEECSDLAA